MINLFNAEIEAIFVHKVGNKCREEGVFLSDVNFSLHDEIRPLLKEYLLKPFRDTPEQYLHFDHDVSLEYNEMKAIVDKCFKGFKEIWALTPEDGARYSKDIAVHLYNQSTHPHIKSGEVYVVYFSNVSIDNEVVDAIGVFKSEIKKDFIQIIERSSHTSYLELSLQQGISLEKIDKGCLIFDKDAENGYKILSIDNNRYDARYWLENFLQVDVLQDENYYTKQYMKMVQDFAKDVVLPAEDKKEEVMFLNRSANYFAKNDEFEETNFINEVLDNQDLIPEFNHYKTEKGSKYSIEDVTNFPIAAQAVTDARKKFKNVIELDTHVSIKMDFINPDSAEKFIEKGWDEEKQMYYYLIYFNKEQK